MPLVLIDDEVAEDRGFITVRLTHAGEQATCYLTQDVFSLLAGADVNTQDRYFLFHVHRARLMRALIAGYDAGRRPVVITSSDLRAPEHPPVSSA